MARPIATTAKPNGRARVDINLPAELKEALRRRAFEEERAASAIIEEAVRAYLRGGPAARGQEEPQADWVDMGAAGWAAMRFACPASAEGASLAIDRDAADSGWRWAVKVQGRVVAAGGMGMPLRSLTAAMLEAEAAAAALTAEDIAKAGKARKGARR